MKILLQIKNNFNNILILFKTILNNILYKNKYFQIIYKWYLYDKKLDQFFKFPWMNIMLSIFIKWSLQ